MEYKKRSKFIDVMKGILIAFVVIGHLPFFEYNSRTLTLIYSFHMPAFLIIGGMLSHIDKNTKLSSIILKRIKTTLIPYFSFYIISFFLIPIDTSTTNHLAAVKAVFRGLGDPVNSINLPLWFLTFYFVAMTTFEIIEYISYRISEKLSKKNNYQTIVILNLIFITIFMTISYIYARIYKMPRLPFNIEVATFCLLFVFIGKLISVYVKPILNDIISSKPKRNKFIIVAFFVIILFTIIWYVYSMKNGRIDLNARDYKNALYMYCDAILGFIIFAYIGYIISTIPFISSIISYIGKNSIYILAYHIPSSYLAFNFIISYLPDVIRKMLSVNSIYSITILTSLYILISLVMSLIHKICNKITH